MSAEHRDVEIKPVHVTKVEAATAVASGLLVGIGIVAAPYVALGGGLVGLGMAMNVVGREAEEKSRQRSGFKKGGEIVFK